MSRENMLLEVIAELKADRKRAIEERDEARAELAALRVEFDGQRAIYDSHIERYMLALAIHSGRKAMWNLSKSEKADITWALNMLDSLDSPL